MDIGNQTEDRCRPRGVGREFRFLGFPDRMIRSSVMRECEEQRMQYLPILFFVAASLSCTQAYSADRAKNTQCVGYASVDEVGSIQLNLFSTESTHGGAMLILDKQHPLFDEMKKHLGKLTAGKWKCVKSMPSPPSEPPPSTSTSTPPPVEAAPVR